MGVVSEHWKKNIDQSFIQELSADEISTNVPRQVHNAHYSYVAPKPTAKPELIIANEALASVLGFSADYLKSEEFLNLVSGNSTIEGMKPYAMCYGGHQFGQWAGQLGDGRAINLCQVKSDQKSHTLQLKGAGPTPYSRRADGFAVLRSSIREFLMSEAMYHLGVPTTRALSLSLTGDQVLRDVMYDGNPAYEKGAIVCRVSESFIRFGNFQIFASRGDTVRLKSLLDYTIKHHYPSITSLDKEGYLQFFRAVTAKTLDLMVEWQRVGFVHGVMNTDNMSILGETIDYGPYGWVDNYDPSWTPNTTDNATKRYRFGNQPYIAQWNLAQLANAIYPLIEESEPLIEILTGYKEGYHNEYLIMMASKLGLDPSQIKEKDISELDELLRLSETDMTIFFRELSHVKKSHTAEEAITQVEAAFYDELVPFHRGKWKKWFESYLSMLNSSEITDQERATQMNTVNPKYVLRNYMAQLAIDKAEKGDYSLIHELYTILQEPYHEQVDREEWYARRPDWAKNKVGCSALSCSS